MTIKNIRLQNGILQKYVAKQLGYSLKQYQRIEEGTARLKPTVAKKLSEILRCELSQILDNKEVKTNERI